MDHSVSHEFLDHDHPLGFGLVVGEHDLQLHEVPEPLDPVQVDAGASTQDQGSFLGDDSAHAQGLAQGHVQAPRISRGADRVA